MTDDKTTLELDRYERDNLIALLKVIYGGYAGPLDTGDWCGQIYWKLTDGKGYDPSQHKPNLSPEDQLQNVRQFWDGLKGGNLGGIRFLPNDASSSQSARDGLANASVTHADQTFEYTIKSKEGDEP